MFTAGLMLSSAGTATAATDPRCPTTLSSSLALKLFYNGHDNFTAITDQGVNDALAAGYGCARVEGYAFPQWRPGTVPLWLYYSNTRGDNFTASSPEAESDAFAAGYQRVRMEGYVYKDRQPGTVPLHLFWNSRRSDNFSTSTTQGEADARAAGYSHVRDEGFVSMYPTYLDMDLYTYLGSGHRMSTTGALDMPTGPMRGTTWIHSDTCFGGFTGAVALVLEDANGYAIAATPRHTFGVDGYCIGNDDRTVVWQDTVSGADAQRAAKVHVFQYWAPQNSLRQIIENGVAALKPIGDLIKMFNNSGGSAQ